MTADMRKLITIVTEGNLVTQHGGREEVTAKRAEPGFEETWEPYKTVPSLLRSVPPDLSDERAVEAMANALVRCGMTSASYREAAAQWNAASTTEDRDRVAGWIASDDGLEGCGLAMRVLVAVSVQRGIDLLSLFPLLMRAAKMAAAGVHDDGTDQAVPDRPKLAGVGGN